MILISLSRIIYISHDCTILLLNSQNTLGICEDCVILTSHFFIIGIFKLIQYQFTHKLLSYISLVSFPSDINLVNLLDK